MKKAVVLNLASVWGVNCVVEKWVWNDSNSGWFGTTCGLCKKYKRRTPTLQNSYCLIVVLFTCFVVFVTQIKTCCYVFVFCFFSPFCFTVGATRGVWALAAERSVSGRVSMWGQLSLCHSRLSRLVCVRGHSQCLPLPHLWETQLPDLQGMKYTQYTHKNNTVFNNLLP